MKYNKNDGCYYLLYESLEVCRLRFFRYLLLSSSQLYYYSWLSIKRLPTGHHHTYTQRSLSPRNVRRRLPRYNAWFHQDQLSTPDPQFWFKCHRSTSLCTMLLKEVISYYTRNDSSLYIVFLDATKESDKVEYCSLFTELMKRDILPLIVTVLLNIYTRYRIRVLWNSAYSNSFSVSNGVKQVAIYSAEFNSSFNAAKSKCLFFRFRNVRRVAHLLHVRLSSREARILNLLTNDHIWDT
jgi:hypothetical protein